MAEQRVLQAKISNKISKKACILTFCFFLLLPVLLLFIGFAPDAYQWESWFGLHLEEGKLLVGNLVLLIFIMVILSTIPFFVYFVLNILKRKHTALTVSETEVLGIRTPFFKIAEITLRIPIDKIASIRKIKSFLFLYTGDVVCISTASSTFKIPFVLNADEIIAFLSDTLAKKPSAPPHRGVIEDLEKFAQLRDAGILTEEEFNRKKRELLSTENSS